VVGRSGCTAFFKPATGSMGPCFRRDDVEGWVSAIENTEVTFGNYASCHCEERSEKAIHCSRCSRWIGTLALATTPQNGLLKNLEPFSPYRHGNSIALVMPIRTPLATSALPTRAYRAIGGASIGNAL
jgi:hypothetical protein